MMSPQSSVLSLVTRYPLPVTSSRPPTPRHCQLPIANCQLGTTRADAGRENSLDELVAQR